MKVKLTATIPVMQYGNIQPEIEVEADTFSEAYELGMGHIRTIWDDCGEKPLPKRDNEGFVKLESEFGSAWFRESDHQYRDDNGKSLISASQYVNQFKKDFPKDHILGAMSKKYGFKPGTISDSWAMKSDVSTLFGKAIHCALELYGKHKPMIDKIDSVRANEAKNKNKEHTRKEDFNPVIKTIVENFYKGREDEKALYEVVVSDENRAGQIDRILFTGEKTVRIQDYKTGTTLDDETTSKMKAPYEEYRDIAQNHYALQLSYYADLVEKRGYTVEGLDIFHLVGTEWKTISVNRIPIKEI